MQKQTENSDSFEIFSDEFMLCQIFAFNDSQCKRNDITNVNLLLEHKLSLVRRMLKALLADLIINPISFQKPDT